MKIRNKVMIVTGASSGIGMATAKLFTKHGAKIALVARSKEKLDLLSRKLPNSIAIRADMTKATDIKNMVKKVHKYYGRVDVLINNAGRGYDDLVENINLKNFRYIIDLDLIGPIIAMQQVIPLMRKQGGGTIVNISSGTTLMYLPSMSPYSSIKTALNVISLTGRKELAADKIRVTVVYPYMTATNFEKNTLHSLFQQQENSDASYDNLPPLDPPEKVAEKILEAVQTGKAEIFANKWMNKGETIQ